MKSVIYRRKREGRTDYKKRLNLLVSRKNRVVIRKSLKAIQIQVVEYLPDGDKILISTHSRELKKYGIEGTVNIPVAYLTGLLCGMKAKKAGIKEGIVDLGLQRAHSGGKLLAAINGLVDSGFDVPYGEESFPTDERVSGEHISTESVKKAFAKAKEEILAE